MSEPYFEYFWNKIQESAFLKTKKGLFFIVFSLYILTRYVFESFRSPKATFIVFITLSILYFFWWLYFSGRLFFSQKIKILFAINLSEETKTYYEQVKKTINSKIDELNLSRAIEIIQMPSDLLFPTKSKAEQYVKKRMVDLLVWGHTLEGDREGSKISEFRLHFTYLYKILPEEKRTIFIKQIKDNLKGRYWRILSAESFRDIQVVSGNITEVAFFILGLCLYVRGELKTSLQIFEKSKTLLTHKNEQEFPQKELFLKQINQYLIGGYKFIGETLRYNKMQESKENFEKVLALDPNNSEAHLNLARLCYLVDNDLDAAKTHTDRVTDPIIKPLTNYNYAFFAIKERNPSKVLLSYQRTKAHLSANIIEDIILFLQNEFIKDPENILFNFALGYVNAYHGDLKIGIEELSNFIGKAKEKPEHQQLVENARSLLAHRKKRSKFEKII